MALTALQAERLNKSSPAAELDGLGTELKRVGDDLDTSEAAVAALEALVPRSVYHITKEISADSTAGDGLPVPIPFACKVVEVLGLAKAAEVGATVAVKVAGADMVAALPMAADGVLSRPPLYDYSKFSLTAASVVTVKGSHATVRGTVTLVVEKA